MSLVKMKVNQNNAGIWPAGDRVLVEPDPMEELFPEDSSLKGFQIPDEYLNRYKQSQASGTLVAVGPDAFSHTTEKVYHIHDGGREELVEKRTKGYSAPFASVGDRVAYAMYSGLRVKGEDGKEYLILNDEDITARVSDNVEFTKLDTRKTLGSQKRV